MTKLIYCPQCKIPTNHKPVTGGWICWCGEVTTNTAVTEFQSFPKKTDGLDKIIASALLSDD